MALTPSAPARHATSPAASPASSARASRSLVRWSHAAKQAKFILGGGLPMWYLNVPGQVVSCVRREPSAVFWTRPLAYTTLVCVPATALLLAWVMLLPARGLRPNYAQWHTDPSLRKLIPQLTLTIVMGFVSLFLLLSPVGTSGSPPYGWSPSALATFAKEWMVNRQLSQTRFWAWSLALVGSTCSFLFLFGVVGLLGSIFPPASVARRKQL